MTLPLTRDKNYIQDFTSVDAADLDRLQDCIIGKWHGSIDEYIGFSDAEQFSGVWTKSSPGLVSPNGTSVCKLVLRYPVGTTITGIDVEIDQDSASQVTVILARHNADGGGAATQESVPSGASTGGKTVPLVGSHLVEAGYIYSIQVTSLVANNEIYSAKVTHHKAA